MPFGGPLFCTYSPGGTGKGIEPKLGQAWTPALTSLRMTCYSVSGFAILGSERDISRIAKLGAWEFGAAAATGEGLPACCEQSHRSKDESECPEQSVFPAGSSFWTLQLHKAVDFFSFSGLWTGSLLVLTERWVGSLIRFVFKVGYFIRLRNCYFCLSVLNFSLRSYVLLFIFNMC